MRYFLLLSILLAFALGYVPESFRMQSTAGIWKDDYDVIFDPARITELTGHRVYTALANYASGSGYQFSPNPTRFFLIGGSTCLGNALCPAGIYDRYGYRIPQFTGLRDAYTGDSLFGSGRSDSVNWLDPDTNGTYDYKQVRRQERNAWRSAQGNDVYLGLGIAGRNSRWGIALAYRDSGTRTVSPDWNYVLHHFDSSLFAGRLTYLRDDTAQREDMNSRTDLSLVLSGRFILKGGSQFGLLLRPGLINRYSSYGSIGWLYADRNPGNTVKNYTLSHQSDTAELSYQGFSLPAQLQWVGNDSFWGETWLTLGGYYQQQQPSSSAGQRSSSYYEQTTNPGIFTARDTIQRRYRGLTTEAGINLSLLQLHSISTRLDLGWGIGLDLNSSADSLFDSLALYRIEHYDDGDSLPTRADYERYISSGESWSRRTADRQLALTLPVGLEFRVIPGIALRLGARHTISCHNRNTISHLLSLSPTHTRTVYGDGSFSETWNTPRRQTTGSETRQIFDQTTLFTYGAGFRPVEQLQIDLMGFAELTNLANWRLSATFRF